MRSWTLLMCCLVVAVTSGCGVRRTIEITSTPDGALVYLNDRELGRTPIATDFTFYGTYDVRVVREGCEPLIAAVDANAPLWDAPGFDFFAESLPPKKHSVIVWHFDLEPRNNDPVQLIERAQGLRAELGRDGPEPADVSVEEVTDEAPPPDEPTTADPPPLEDDSTTGAGS